MQNIKIQTDITEESYTNKKYFIIDFLYELDIIYYKKFLNGILLISFIIFIAINKLYYTNIYDLKSFKKYIRDCKKNIFYERNKIYNKYPYIAVCLSALNMENYIEKNLLSILNQSFQDFEIVVVNDKSTDETENIIHRIQLEDDRVKLLSHSQNLGVYRSRIESIINAKSQFILLMDPDDMYLNENLLQILYDYNIKNNLDIIEFTVYHQFEGKNKIIFPDNDYETHNHKYLKNIISQPELSEILYYIPGTKEYSHTFCRNIWNKMIRRDIFIKTHKYIGKDYFNDFIIAGDDMIMNIISYQFAKNYTNINLPGYLYIIRKVSISRGDGDRKLMKIKAVNYLSYFKLFYKYLQEYNKDRNFLYFEMRDLQRFILYIKEKNMIPYIIIQINFIKKIIKDKYISEKFKSYLNNILLLFTNK